MVVAGSADIGVEDWHAVGRSPLRRLPIELVVEDRAHRAIGQRAELDRPRGRGFEAVGAKRTHQADDAETGAEALFGVRPALQDQLAQRGRGRTNRSRLAANALDGPVGPRVGPEARPRTGSTPVARRHVIGDGGVPLIAAGAQMRGDPLALQENLDGARRQPHLDLAAGEAVGDAVEMSFDLDVIIEADPAQPPFGEGIGIAGQQFEVRPIEFLEQRAAGDPKPADRPFLIELPQQLADRRIQFGQAVKPAMAQPPEQPAFDDQHRGFDPSLRWGRLLALSRGRRGRAGRTAVS
jgi:hypothetical protein